MQLCNHVIYPCGTKIEWQSHLKAAQARFACALPLFFPELEHPVSDVRLARAAPCQHRHGLPFVQMFCCGVGLCCAALTWRAPCSHSHSLNMYSRSKKLKKEELG